MKICIITLVLSPIVLQIAFLIFYLNQQSFGHFHLSFYVIQLTALAVPIISFLMNLLLNLLLHLQILMVQMIVVSHFQILFLYFHFLMFVLNLKDDYLKEKIKRTIFINSNFKVTFYYCDYLAILCL